jgi:cytochrome c
MKKLVTVLAAVGGLMIAGAAQADAELAKAKGCLNCHAVDTKKMGPSFKDSTAKYKGDKEAVAKLVAGLKEGKSIGGKAHPKVAGTDDELKKVAAWALSQ